MVGIAAVLRFLYPAADPFRDWVVVNEGANDTIKYWNPALSAQPDNSTLANTLASGAFATWLAAHGGDATQTARRVAGNLVDGQTEDQVMLRALLLVLLDEINTIRAAMVHPITSITRVSTTATVTTPSAHGLSNGTIAIFGATQVQYNGVQTITVTGANTFTFVVAGSPTTPATGTILYAMGAVPATLPRTANQLRTAIKTRITAGDADS